MGRTREKDRLIISIQGTILGSVLDSSENPSCVCDDLPRRDREGAVLLGY
jgi:hypothetical protein